MVGKEYSCDPGVLTTRPLSSIEVIKQALSSSTIPEMTPVARIDSGRSRMATRLGVDQSGY